MRTFWDDTREARLRELLAAKHTYAQCARELGCTEGTVAGKATRLGLAPGRQKPFTRLQTNSVLPGQTKKHSRPPDDAEITKRIARINAASRVRPDHKGIDYFACKTSQCAWVMNDDVVFRPQGEPLMVCGEPAVADTRWCKTHHQFLRENAYANPLKK